MKTIILTVTHVEASNIRTGRAKEYLSLKVPSVKPPFRVLCATRDYIGADAHITIEFVCDKITPPTAPWVYHSWNISEMVDLTRTAGKRVRTISEYGLKQLPATWQYV